MATDYVLRVVRGDMTSRGGFRWPMPDEDLGHGPGVVVAPDWDPAPVCGGGLHGWLRGEGDPTIASCIDVDDPSARWLVVEVEWEEVVSLFGEKVKFPSGRVVFVDGRAEAVQHLASIGAAGDRCNWRVMEGASNSTQTAGDRSTQTAGWHSTQTAGGHSTQTAGDRSTQTAGDRSTQTAGWHSTQTAGDLSTQTAGDHSTQTAGDRSTQTAGAGSKHRAGLGSVFICRYYREVWQTAVAVVDGEKIKANTFYRYSVASGAWEEVSE